MANLLLYGILQVCCNNAVLTTLKSQASMTLLPSQFILRWPSASLSFVFDGLLLYARDGSLNLPCKLPAPRCRAFMSSSW